MGVLGAVGAGVHVGVDNPQPVSGVVPAALVELTQHISRFRVHVDGVPTVTASASSAGASGRSWARLSLLDAIAMIDADPRSRFRFGTGIQIINLANYNGNNGVRNFDHIATQIYAAGSTLPLPKRHFVDVNVYVAPNLRTNLHLIDDMGVPEPLKYEQGAEIYYSAAYGWTHGRSTYLIGFAALSYHTRDTTTGELLDRNVGGGATFEYRYRLGAY